MPGPVIARSPAEGGLGHLLIGNTPTAGGYSIHR
jgi:hypothetical protein